MTIDEHTSKMYKSIVKGIVTLVIGGMTLTYCMHRDDTMAERQVKRKELQELRAIKRTERAESRHAKWTNYAAVAKENINHICSTKPTYHSQLTHHPGSVHQSKPTYSPRTSNTTPNYNNKSIDNYNKDITDQMQKQSAEINALKAYHVADSTNLASITQQSDQYAQQTTNYTDGYVPTRIVQVGISVGNGRPFRSYSGRAGHMSTMPNRYSRANEINNLPY